MRIAPCTYRRLMFIIFITYSACKIVLFLLRSDLFRVARVPLLSRIWRRSSAYEIFETYILSAMIIEKKSKLYCDAELVEAASFELIIS